MAGLLVPVDSRFRGNDGVGLHSIFIAMTMGALRCAQNDTFYVQFSPTL